MAVRKPLVILSGVQQELPSADSLSIALGWLQQGGATSGQVITWSGSAWAPATPSGGGGGISHATSDGRNWASKDGAWSPIPAYYSSSTQPIVPTGNRMPGDKWYNLDTGQELTWVYDGNTGQWVNLNGAGAAITTTASDIEITDSTKGVIMRSPNGTRWRLTVNDSGVGVFTSI